MIELIINDRAPIFVGIKKAAHLSSEALAKEIFEAGLEAVGKRYADQASEPAIAQLPKMVRASERESRRGGGKVFSTGKQAMQWLKKQ